MELYDVKARGLHSPLNSGEIAQLFRSGQIGRRLPCKPRDEATWRTIDELFPLLKYEGAAPRQGAESRRSRNRGPFVSSSALILVLLGTLLLHSWIKSAPTGARRSDQPKQVQSAGRVVTQLAQTTALANSNLSAQPFDHRVVIADQGPIR